jgi:integrase
MRPNKSRKPFTLYRKETQTGPVWYARFWDETTRRYAVTRSTSIPVEGKKQRRYEAEQAAREILPTIRFTPPAPEKSFVQYVADFWLPDSVYVEERALVKKQPLSVEYVTMNHENVRRHMEPFSGFQGVTLQCLTAGVIRDWMTWAVANGRTGRSVNTTLQAMRIAVRYAVAREELPKDPFRNIKNVTENSREKGILSPSEVSRLIQSPAHDPYNRLAVLLGIFCGLRRGEVRGLQWGDIENGIINIRHNYLENEGLKTPKCGSVRMVPVPQSVQLGLDIICNLSGSPQPNDFVLHNPVNPDKPFSPKYFQRALANELRAIGIQEDEQKQRNLTFHGLRHTFVTLGRLAGITDLEIQALAGHKSGAMMERYSHAGQVLDFVTAREKLEKAVGI